MCVSSLKTDGCVCFWKKTKAKHNKLMMSQESVKIQFLQELGKT